jgi:hypothetical protein
MMRTNDSLFPLFFSLYPPVNCYSRSLQSVEELCGKFESGAVRQYCEKLAEKVCIMISQRARSSTPISDSSITHPSSPFLFLVSLSPPSPPSSPLRLAPRRLLPSSETTSRLPSVPLPRLTLRLTLPRLTLTLPRLTLPRPTLPLLLLMMMMTPRPLLLRPLLRPQTKMTPHRLLTTMTRTTSLRWGNLKVNLDEQHAKKATQGCERAQAVGGATRGAVSVGSARQTSVVLKASPVHWLALVASCRLAVLRQGTP